jgi:hypothetical protein
MARMTKHGVAGWRVHQCRCKVCTKAYAQHLKAKRARRVTTGRLPSVTNTLEHDTMTRGQYDRLRG